MVGDADLGAFKTPTLRNVARTAPYMHTGAFASLWDVVSWYNLAAGTDGFVGKREAASLVPLHLSNEEMSDLVEFMKALEISPDPELAMRWIDYLLETGPGDVLVQRQGLANTTTPSPFHRPDARLHWLEPVEDTQKRTRMWDRIVSGDRAAKVLAA